MPHMQTKIIKLLDHDLNRFLKLLQIAHFVQHPSLLFIFISFSVSFTVKKSIFNDLWPSDRLYVILITTLVPHRSWSSLTSHLLVKLTGAISGCLFCVSFKNLNSCPDKPRVIPFWLNRRSRAAGFCMVKPYFCSVIHPLIKLWEQILLTPSTTTFRYGDRG